MNIATSPNIRDLDIFGDIGSCFISGEVNVILDPFIFQAIYMGVSHDVIVAVTPAAHAYSQVMLTKKLF